MNQGNPAARAHGASDALTLGKLLGQVDWSKQLQPRWNDVDTVPRALRALAACKGKPGSERAYENVLSALGNNHAGTYYPVVLAVMPALEFILSLGEPMPREMALCVIYDLYMAFHPQPGFETIRLDRGRIVRVEDLFRQRVHELRELLFGIGQRESPMASMAREIIELIPACGSRSSVSPRFKDSATRCSALLSHLLNDRCQSHDDPANCDRVPKGVNLFIRYKGMAGAVGLRRDFSGHVCGAIVINQIKNR